MVEVDDAVEEGVDGLGLVPLDLKAAPATAALREPEGDRLDDADAVSGVRREVERGVEQALDHERAPVAGVVDAREHRGAEDLRQRVHVGTVAGGPPPKQPLLGVPRERDLEDQAALEAGSPSSVYDSSDAG